MRTSLLPRLFKPCLVSCWASSALVAAAQTNTSATPVNSTNPPAVANSKTLKLPPQTTALAPEASRESFFTLHKVTDDDDWTHHFRLGAVAGLGITANFKMNGNFSINSGSGIYDNGYVHNDNTGSTDGKTSYWGYNTASQYDAANNKLYLTQSSQFNASSEGSGDDTVPVGLDLAYGGNLYYWKHVRVGWELGFDMLPIGISDSHPMSGSVTQNKYAFDTAGVVLPDAPYQGGSSGQGPLISTIGNLVGTTNSAGTITGSRKLDVMYYAIKLGPTFYADLCDDVAISIGAGPAVGIVSGEYRYDEVVVANGLSAHNKGSFSDTEMVFGGYINSTLMYHFKDNNRNADIYISAQYMPMGEAVFSSAGREAHLNLSGSVMFSLGMNWPF